MSSSFEHDPAVSGIHLADLNVPVQSYVKKLHASLMEIYKKYEVSNKKELAEKIRDGSVSVEDRERAIELVTLMRDCGKKNKIVGREFEAPIIEQEEERLEAFFGKKIDVPPLPESIDQEHIEFWKDNGFKLQYWPKIRMEKTMECPGWIHRPGKRNNPKDIGIEFYDDLNKIKNLPENLANHNLDNLEPDELPGVWMLVDSRKKPDNNDGKQSYETDKLKDSLVQSTLKQLLTEKVLNQGAAECLRNNIDPSVFSNPKFWKAFKQAFKLDDIPTATVRLPRTIEANVMGQGPDYHDTTTFEWHEEYYGSGRRLLSGNSGGGGASCVIWRDFPRDSVGFRPLVVFP